MRARDILASHGELLAGAEGGVQCLRDLVIDFGMQGLLVEQDSSDAPAEASLCAAREAAPARDKSWKLIEPALDSKDRNDRLPTGWALASINDCGRFINGIGFKKAEWKSDGLPIIRIQNLTDESKPFNYAQGDYPEDHLVEDGDLLVSWSASLDAFVWRRGPAVVNQHIFKVVPFRELVEPRFLYWLLRRTIRQMVRGEHMRGMGMKHIKRGPFLSHAVAIPPLREQARIVSKVDELMALCDELEEKQQHRHTVRRRFQTSALDALANAESADELAESWERVRDNWEALTEHSDSAESLRRTLAELAVRGRLVPQEASEQSANELFPLIESERNALLAEGAIRKPRAHKPHPSDPRFQAPAGWAWTTLGALSFLITDGAHHTPTYTSEGVPFISIKDISGGHLDFSDCKFISEEQHKELRRRCEPKRGDLLFCRIGTLGRPVVVKTDRRFSVFVSVGLIRVAADHVSPDYLALVLNSPFLYAQYEEVKAGGSHANKLNLGSMPGLHIPLPPRPEQDRIVARFNELRGVCDELEQRISDQQKRASRFAESVVHSLTSSTR